MDILPVYTSMSYPDRVPWFRSQFIIDTLAASVGAGNDSSGSAEETDDREHTVNVADIPWGGFMRVQQRKRVEWKISLRGRFVNKEDNSEPNLDAAFHYQR